MSRYQSLTATALVMTLLTTARAAAPTYGIRPLGPAATGFFSAGKAINLKDEALADGVFGMFNGTPSMFLPFLDYGMPAGLDYLPFFGYTNFIGVSTGWSVDLIIGADARPFPLAFNDQGQILGTLRVPSHAGIWQNQQVNDLGTVAGPISVPFALNQQGDVIGLSTTSSGDTNHLKPFILLAGTAKMQPIAGLQDDYTSLLAFNNRRQIVATTTNGDVIWQGGLVKSATEYFGFDPGPPYVEDPNNPGNSYPAPGTYNVVKVAALNDLGEILAYVTTTVYTNDGSPYGILAGGEIHSLIYSPAGGNGLKPGLNYDVLRATGGPGFPDKLIAWNTNGQFIYLTDYNQADKLPTYIYWDKGQSQPLTNLFPRNSGWTDITPFGLNNRGDVVGEGLLNGGFYRGFLLTLTPLAVTVSVANTDPIVSGDTITVLVSATNVNATEVILNVQQKAAPTTEGTGAQFMAGPSPAGSFTLNPGQGVTFTDTFLATNAGVVTFFATVTGTDPKGAVSSSANSLPVVILSPFTLAMSTLPAGRTAKDKPVEVYTTVGNISHRSNNVLKQAGLTKDITVAGSGGVAFQSGPLPTGAVNLNPGEVFTFTNLYLTSKYGTVTFTGTASATEASGNVDNLSTSVPLTIAPGGDLLIKRDAVPAYAGLGIFQTVPADPQIKTNVVALNEDSKFQIQIQNNDEQPQTFTLAARPMMAGWTSTYLLGAQDMTAQLEASGGASLPELAPGQLLTLDVTMRATLAPPSDIQRIDFILGLASDATLTLDAVEAVTQLAPDLVALTLAWNSSVGGLDFTYTNRGSALTNDTTAKLFWASGPTTNDIISAIYTTNIPAGFINLASNHVEEVYFESPPSKATYLQVVLDPNNLNYETTKTNNMLATHNTFRHVVLVMMENRSFDHFLGWLTGAEGMQPSITYTNPSAQSFPNWHLTFFQGCSCDDPDHSYRGGRIALNATKNPPACDGWLFANTNDIFSIGYYLQKDLSFLGQVAPNWTVCDHYFAAILAETQPNRIYQHAAQTDSLVNRTTLSLTLPTIWDTLSQSNISARYYSDTSYGLTPLMLWGATKYRSIINGLGNFYSDCQKGTLPAVSYVDPVLTSTLAASILYDNSGGKLGNDTGGNDDHPHSDIRNGEAFLADIYTAIASSPNWASTVLIINFDEWGGFFDHVPPPKLPAGSVPEADALAYQAAGITPDDPTYGSLGFRVPCIVISPWSHKGKVAKGVFDHTSVLKLIENRWNLPNLTSHDLNANDLTNVLDFASPDFSPPPVLSYVPPGPFGSPCKTLGIKVTGDGGIAIDWDATCMKIVLQTAPAPEGPWNDVTGILAPPYFLSNSQIIQRAQGVMRFRIVQ